MQNLHLKNMMIYKFLLICILLSWGVSHTTQAQNEWTLEQCIEHARKNNIQVKQAEQDQQSSRVQLTQAYGNAMPDISGNATHVYNFGRTIDPFTNQFATDKVQSNNFALSGNLTLFNGFQNYNRIIQNQLALKASKTEVDRILNDISLNVATAFLQVLYNDELLASAKERSQNTQKELERTKKLYDAGSVSVQALREMEAQQASEELQVVNAQNQLDLSYLSLTQLLELESTENFKIIKPVVEVKENLLPENPAQIYAVAIQEQPVIRSAQFQAMSAQRNLSAAKGLYSPRLVFNGSFGTGYSGISKRFTSFTNNGNDTIGFTSSNDLVLAPSLVPNYETIPFKDQFNDNLNSSIGFYLTIPFFTGFQTKTQVSLAKIQLQNAEYNLELQKKQLRKTIIQAYADAMAALKKYQVAEKNMNAQGDVLRFSEKKFEVGTINAFELNQSKSRYAVASSELIQAKYDFIFKLKVLDFYQGKPITL